MTMSYTPELFRNVYWTFADQAYGDPDAFMNALRAYHASFDLNGNEPDIDWDAVCLESASVVFQYAIFPKTEDEDIEEKFERVDSDNGESFTAKELLFKMHNLIGYKYLADEDNHFFEGLTYMQDQDPEFEGIPIYFVDAGS